MTNRRELLRASAALAAGVGVAGLASCGDDDRKVRSVETISTVALQQDVALLGALLDLEQSSVVAYDTMRLGSAAPYGAHERRHAATVRRMLGELGADAPPAKPPAEYRASFPPLRSERDRLAFALDVETTSIGAYADALGKVATDGVRVTLGAILAGEAEHEAVLLGRLGRPQVPDAFVTGPPPRPAS